MCQEVNHSGNKHSGFNNNGIYSAYEWILYPVWGHVVSFWTSAWVQWVTGDRRCSPCTRPPGWWFLCGHDSTDSSVWSASGPTGRSSSCPPHSAVLSTVLSREMMNGVRLPLTCPLLLTAVGSLTTRNGKRQGSVSVTTGFRFQTKTTLIIPFQVKSVHLSGRYFKQKSHTIISLFSRLILDCLVYKISNMM